MPKPDDVTPYDIEQWEQLRLDTTSDDDLAVEGILPNYVPPDPKEMFYSSQWLRRQLENIGVDGDALDEAMQSDGQRQFFGPIRKVDPWDVAQESFDLYREGKLDPPGEALARKLSEEHLPKLIGVKHLPPDRTVIVGQCYQLNAVSVESDGDKVAIPIPKMIHVTRQGEIVISALALGSPLDCYNLVKKTIEDGAIEVCFALDRWLKDGQGTTLKDGFTLQYWNGHNWQFGIAEYDASGARPVDWANEFWAETCAKETSSIFGDIRVTKKRTAPTKPKQPQARDFRNTENLLRESPSNFRRAIKYLYEQGYEFIEVSKMITIACTKLGIKPGKELIQ